MLKVFKIQIQVVYKPIEMLTYTLPVGSYDNCTISENNKLRSQSPDRMGSEPWLYIDSIPFYRMKRRKAPEVISFPLAAVADQASACLASIPLAQAFASLCVALKRMVCENREDCRSTHSR